jgi:Arc/MetJ-type ribon-helix-helix transcriptional regulator
MGVGSLKKGASTNSVAAASSPVADEFINAARIDGKGTKPTGQVRTKKWKQLAFSLTEEVDQEVNRLSLLPSGVRVSRSDVIREALRFFAAQGDDVAAQLLKQAKERELGE